MNTQTDSDALLRRARDGDHSAFIELLVESDKVMRSVAYAVLGQADEMDDMLQEASIKAFRSMNSYKGESAFSTWIYRIVYNTAVDYLRKTSKVRRITSVDDLGTLVEPDSSSRGEAIETRRDLEAALQQLSAEHRAAVWMIDVNGLTYAEASSVLGIPEGTLASRLATARKTLRHLLAIDDGGSEQ